MLSGPLERSWREAGLPPDELGVYGADEDPDAPEWEQVPDFGDEDEDDEFPWPDEDEDENEE